MAENTPINISAFAPYGGGQGVRLSLTTVSISSQIPMAPDCDRVLVSNGGSVSAFICLGGTLVGAGLGNLEILPGTQVLLSPPYVGTQALFIAGITESGTTKIQVTAGRGT